MMTARLVAGITAALLRLAGFGVSTMLFLPSRMGRTSTMPPRDKPEASRRLMCKVPWAALETVIVSKTFTAVDVISNSRD